MTAIRTTSATLAALVCAAAIASAHTPAPTSATGATELAALLAEHQLDTFAAKDPDADNRFLAVLLIPNAQLLVVSAEYPTPATLQALLAQKNYRDVYAALHQPASAPTRFFLLDLGCDGLLASGGAVDVLYEQGVTQTLFNGDWKSQDLSERDYRSKVEETERRYSQILSHLTGALRATATALSP